MEYAIASTPCTLPNPALASLIDIGPESSDLIGSEAASIMGLHTDLQCQGAIPPGGYNRRGGYTILGQVADENKWRPQTYGATAFVRG